MFLGLCLTTFLRVGSVMGMKILLVDDERSFVDGREYQVARTSWEAIKFFINGDDETDYNGAEFDEVWLDFNLVGSDSGMEFCNFVREAARTGNRLNIGRFVIHTSSWAGANLMAGVLQGAGYDTERFDMSFQNPVVIK